MRGFSRLEGSSYSVRFYTETSLTKFIVFRYDRYQLEQRFSCQEALLPLSFGEWLSPQIISKSDSLNQFRELAWTHRHSRMLAYPYPRPYPTPSTPTLYTFSQPSFIAVARRTYSTDGMAGFYRGLTPTLLRAFPMNASALFAYEGIMQLLGAEEARNLRFYRI